MDYCTRDVTEVVGDLGYIFWDYFTHNRCCSSYHLVSARIGSYQLRRFSTTSWRVIIPFC
ncbi:MAG: hypothetical protein R3Y61_07710 [Rikenellaceae bacterium]